MKKLLIIGLIVLSLVLAGCKGTEVTGGVVGVNIATEICEDTDGGIDKGIKGVTSAGDETYSDACVTGILIEYYCDGDSIVNQNMRCANGCSNGKCT